MMKKNSRKRIPWLGLWILALGISAPGILGQSFDPHPLYGPNALAKVHPGWDFADLLPGDPTGLPAGFTGHIDGLGFLPNGKLVVADFPNPSNQPWKGSVWILDGVLTGDKSQVKLKRFADNLYGPGGIAIVAGEIYVIDAKSLKHLTDKDSNGTAEVTEVTHSWNQTGGQPAVLDLVYQNGFFYTNIGNSGGLAVDNVPVAGGTAKIGMDGKIEMLTWGLRNPNGIGIDAGGDIFATDNQGEWLPSSKLIHLVPGRYYGYQPTNRKNQTESPPAVWIPQGIASPPSGDASKYPAGLSPTSPLPITTGPYAGQMFMGDLRYGNIDRIFLEKIQGEYQGSMVHFSGGFNAGINRMAWGPDGALYLGGMGGSGYTWSWKDNSQDDDWGLVRIKPNGKSVFEILATRAKVGGFELQFTSPLAAKSAAAANFKVQSWQYTPTGTYGGPQVDMKTLPVKSVLLSTDKTRLFLEIPGLAENHVVHIEADTNLVLSELGSKAWSYETWYTLNRFGTDAPTSIQSQVPASKGGNFQATAFARGGIRIESESGGLYQIRNARGMVLEEGAIAAHGILTSSHRFEPGLYFVSLAGRPSLKVICM